MHKTHDGGGGGGVTNSMMSFTDDPRHHHCAHDCFKILLFLLMRNVGYSKYDDIFMIVEINEYIALLNLTLEKSLMATFRTASSLVRFTIIILTYI